VRARIGVIGPVGIARIGRLGETERRGRAVDGHRLDLMSGLPFGRRGTKRSKSRLRLDRHCVARSGRSTWFPGKRRALTAWLTPASPSPVGNSEP
jgi:hypothetical protein